MYTLDVEANGVHAVGYGDDTGLTDGIADDLGRTDDLCEFGGTVYFGYGYGGWFGWCRGVTHGGVDVGGSGSSSGGGIGLSVRVRGEGYDGKYCLGDPRVHLFQYRAHGWLGVWICILSLFGLNG